MSANEDKSPWQPKVSIVMPTYNHATYIKQAIESVLSQETDFEIELLLGDDCSTDGTSEICKRYAVQYPDKIIPHLRPRNVGAQANGRALYRAARGEYIALCEGVDYWSTPKKLQRQTEALDRNPAWSGCFHKTVVIHDNKSLPNEYLPPIDLPGELVLEQLTSQNYIATCSVMYRRKLVPEIPEWFAALALGDWPLSILHAQFRFTSLE